MERALATYSGQGLTSVQFATGSSEVDGPGAERAFGRPGRISGNQGAWRTCNPDAAGYQLR